MLSSKIGSVLPDRYGLRTYDAKSDVVALAYISRLQGGRTLLNYDSESTQKFGCIEYWSEISDFRLLNYGSVTDFRQMLRLTLNTRT